MNNLSYEEYLEKYGTMTYSNVGISMMPLLRQGKDLFTVRKKTEARCQKYDVVLYRRPPSHYVLHRVIQVREKDYVILGDNCINKEYGITDDDIIGVMESFVRDGKTYSVSDKKYRLYVFFWCFSIPLRIFLTKLKFKLKRVTHEE